MTRRDEIQERLVNFVMTIIGLCDRLPKSFVSRHVGEQLFRSGTAGAPNYAEAQRPGGSKDTPPCPRSWVDAGHLGHLETEEPEGCSGSSLN
jgi:hypothetical protein